MTAPYSRIRQNIAQILKDEGFIRDFAVEEGSIKVFLKYVEGESVIHEIKRMSKPGRRRYEGYKNLEPVIGGLGISIITTSQGVITDREARQKCCWWRSYLYCLVKVVTMSKIGRRPIDLSSTQVEVKGNEVHIKGKKASGVHILPHELKAEVVNKQLFNLSSSPSKRGKEQWGLHRALLANEVKGADQGFEKQLRIVGLRF